MESRGQGRPQGFRTHLLELLHPGGQTPHPTTPSKWEVGNQTLGMDNVTKVKGRGDAT